MKDIISRRKVAENYKVHYIPGWDCHGLPIELKAIQESENDISPVNIREKARKFASEAIEIQKKAFMKWGVQCDWNNPYLTYDTDYVINELKMFNQLYSRGLIFRDKMPIFWSPSTGTALAEAELQYNPEHISTSVYVRMEITCVPYELKEFENLYAIIWTTTPWTLPANQSIAYSPKDNYSIVKIDNLKYYHFLVATDSITHLQNKFNCSIQIMQTFKGEELRDMMYVSRFDQSAELPFIEGSSYGNKQVDVTKGTGLVHNAPNHGLEDYKLALKNNIKLIDNLVDEKGNFNNNAGSQLKGKFVLTEGTQTVIDILGQDVLLKENYKHSYPYDWRSNKPVITLSSQQWFINMDLLRNKCIRVLDNVNFWPQFGKELIVQQLANRPHWCISRQRSWGVPIPVFYSKQDYQGVNPIINNDIFEQILQSFKTHGVNSWWTLPIDKLVSDKSFTKLGMNCSDLTIGKDIFDIWFDSGLSWSYALPEPKVADVYIEGVDQCRGWFQSSLILSVALRRKAPYKNILIHGFALDENGKKMSKSLGNVIDPNDIIEGKNFLPCGVDGLRWWIFTNGSTHENCRISKNSIEDLMNTINKLRNTFRFIIGSLKDFDIELHRCDLNEMMTLDRYLLHQLNHYIETVNTNYDQFNLNEVAIKTITFVYDTVSSLYFSRIKDRLYCDEKHSVQRRSCQTVLRHLYNAITYQLAPVLPHIIYEVNKYLNFNKINHEEIINWKNDDLALKMQLPMSIIDTLNHELIGKQSNQFDLYIKLLGDQHKNHLNSIPNNELCEILRTSSVFICDNELPQIEGTHLKGSVKSEEIIQTEITEPNESFDYELLMSPSSKYLCERCKRYISEQPDCLCVRCSKVISSQYN